MCNAAMGTDCKWPEKALSYKWGGCFNEDVFFCFALHTVPSKTEESCAAVANIRFNTETYMTFTPSEAEG